jgi:general secretion pathway protein D
VRNKEKAKVVIGDKLPTITTTISSGVGGFASESVNYVDAGLKLEVEPTIYLNNEVGIRISLEVSNLVDTITTKSGTTAYRLGTRSAATMLQLKDGENQVLAGLIKNEDRSSSRKLPGIGDLPVLGRLFGSQQDTRNKTEVVLSITPHLIRNLQRPPASSSEFSAGTEASFRRRPDTSARTPAQLPGQGARAVPGAASARAQPPAQPPASAPLPVVGETGMVPATSVGATGSLPPAPPSVSPSELPAAPAVEVTPLPQPEATPMPQPGNRVPASQAAFPNQK